MSEFVLVGEKEYAVVKTGRAQAEQVVYLSKWLAKYGQGIFSSMKDIGSDDAGGLTFITMLLESLSADALIDLFIVLVGCAKEDAEVYFDVSILVDVLVDVYENQPAVKRLIERFFSEE